MQHSLQLLVDQCMWNKKEVCFQYASVCKNMGFEYVIGDKSEKENNEKWPKNKAAKDNNND